MVALRCSVHEIQKAEEDCSRESERERRQPGRGGRREEGGKKGRRQEEELKNEARDDDLKGVSFGKKGEGGREKGSKNNLFMSLHFLKGSKEEYRQNGGGSMGYKGECTLKMGVEHPATSRSRRGGGAAPGYTSGGGGDCTFLPPNPTIQVPRGFWGRRRASDWGWRGFGICAKEERQFAKVLEKPR